MAVAAGLVKAKGEGDSTFSVFDRPASAVTAALELQLALAAEPCPLPAPLAVRSPLRAGMTPAKATPKIVYHRATAPGCHSKRIPQHAAGRTTGVPDLFPGPVLASLRADPDRPAFEIGPRTVSRVVAPAVGRFYPDRTRRSGSRLRDKDPVWAGHRAGRQPPCLDTGG